MSNWIPVSERMPTREDADDFEQVLARIPMNGGTFEKVCPWNNLPNATIAWLPLPPYTPPELMPTNEECDQLAQDIWASRWSAARDTGIPVIRAWFADVTARIEREKL